MSRAGRDADRSLLFAEKFYRVAGAADSPVEVVSMFLSECLDRKCDGLIVWWFDHVDIDHIIDLLLTADRSDPLLSYGRAFRSRHNIFNLAVAEVLIHVSAVDFRSSVVFLQVGAQRLAKAELKSGLVGDLDVASDDIVEPLFRVLGRRL